MGDRRDLAILAVAIGLAGGGQAAGAAGAGVMAAQQQRAIDFTRANEKEADRVGMQMLAEQLIQDLRSEEQMAGQNAAIAVR